MMRTRMHNGYGHGLRDGTRSDMNCPNCKREDEAGQTPDIREDGQRVAKMRAAEEKFWTGMLAKYPHVSKDDMWDIYGEVSDFFD